jgi:hypothetical protein
MANHRPEYMSRIRTAPPWSAVDVILSLGLIGLLGLVGAALAHVAWGAWGAA